MIDIATLATLAAVTTGLVEVIKRTKFLGFLDGNYPFVALILSVVIGFFTPLGILGGLVAGLMSQGLYSTVTQTGDTVKTMLK